MNKAFFVKCFYLAFVGIGFVFVAKKCFGFVCENILSEFLLESIFFFFGHLYLLLAIALFIAIFDDL